MVCLNSPFKKDVNVEKIVEKVQRWCGKDMMKSKEIKGMKQR